MRRYLKTRILMDNGFLILSLILSLSLVFSFSFGEARSNGVCISKGGRFPPYESEGKPPKAVGRGSKDLNLCRVYRKRTCCSAAQTLPAFSAVRKLASYGEANQECLDLFELLECSICDPTIGIQSGLPLICASFCDRVFEACSNAYFGGNILTRLMAPCGVNDDILCGKLSTMESNGTAFCEAAGFAVQTDESTEEETCYGSRASLDSAMESWNGRGSQTESSLENDTLSPFEHLLQWFEDLIPGGSITWVTISVVIWSGVLFMRRSHDLRLDVNQRGGRRLGGNMYRNPR